MTTENKSVVKEAMYCAWETISKEECVKYTAERMGNGIQTIVPDLKG